MKKFNIYEILSFIFIIGGVTFISLSTFSSTNWVLYLILGIVLLCCSYIFSVISGENARKKLHDIINCDDDDDYDYYINEDDNEEEDEDEDENDWMNTPTIKLDYKEL